MPKYWCRFLNQDDQVVSAERMIALDDGRAIAQARNAAPDRASSFEIWRNVNFIHKESLWIAQVIDAPDSAVASEQVGGAPRGEIARVKRHDKIGR